MVGCGAKKSDAKKIGVAMPTKDLQRWNQDGDNMKELLEKAGYTVDLQYANNEIAMQVSQVENMITGGCDILVIASIDGGSLGTVLATAKEKNIPVIAYDHTEEIFEKVWKEKYYEANNTVMVHIWRLREKMEDNPKDPKLIETVWG